MNRRVFLSALGFTGMGLAGASILRVESNHVFGTGGGPAYEPWTDWQQPGTNPFEQFVRAAVLAASPHNTQPWKFRLVPNGIDVYADTSRHIGSMDPLFREMCIGVGCAIENLLLSAQAAGYRWSFGKPASSPDGSLQPVTRVLLNKGETKHPSDLYAAIPQRHTNRGRNVAGKEVGTQTIKAFSNVNSSDSDLPVFWFKRPEEKGSFGNLVVRATEAIIADKEQSESSARWIRTT
jgi:hypothetical protein